MPERVARRVLIAPQSFKGSADAVSVAAAIARGVRRAWPGGETIELPLADGGEGTVRALVHASGGDLRHTRVHDPLLRDIDAEWGVLGDRTTAVVEMAAANGLPLLREDERDPARGKGEDLPAPDAAASLGPTPEPRCPAFASSAVPLVRPECGAQVVTAGNRIEVRVDGRSAGRFALGRAGDVAVVGDWTCRGATTPALYRPATGELFVFDGWARAGRVRPNASVVSLGPPGGRPVVARGPNGCDRVDVVDRPGVHG